MISNYNEFVLILEKHPFEVYRLRKESFILIIISKSTLGWL